MYSTTTLTTRTINCGIDYVVTDYNGSDIVFLSVYDKYDVGSQRSNVMKDMCFDILNGLSAEDIASIVFNKSEHQEQYDIMFSFDYSNNNAIYSPRVMLNADNKLESYSTCLGGYEVLEILERVVSDGVRYNNDKWIEVTQLLKELKAKESSASEKSFLKWFNEFEQKLAAQ